MRKALSIILAVSLLASALCINSYAALTGSEIKSVYDFNNDGFVNVEDARLVLRVSANIAAPVEGKDYDVDKSGSPLPDYNDVKAVLCVALGIAPDNTVIDDSAYQLELFSNELNSIKEIKPGFKKEKRQLCESVKVTTRNVPSALPNLAVKDMEFRDYIDLLEDELKFYISLSPELKQSFAEMKAQANDIYKEQVAPVEKVGKKDTSHYTKFPIEQLGYVCFLEPADIKSIETVDNGEYIVRTVKMNQDAYIGNEYPTGTSGFKERITLPYGKIFTIPSLSETDGSVVNEVIFKDGLIVSTVDKLTGVPVKVEYSYTYIADIQAPAKLNDDGSEGLGLTKRTTIHVSEVYTINPVEVNK